MNSLLRLFDDRSLSSDESTATNRGIRDIPVMALLNGSDIPESEWRYRVESSAIVGTINFAGFALSCFTISLTFTSELKLNNVNLLLANLVLGTLLHTFMFVLPQNLFVLYMEKLPMAICEWMGYVFFILAAQMILFPPFLAVNRYVSLYHNARYDSIYTTRNIVLQIVGSWTVACLIPLPFQVAGKTGYDADNVHCCIVVRDSTAWTVYYCSVVLLLCCLCDGAMFYWNYKIYKKLREHSTGNSLKRNVVSQNKELFYFMVADTIIPLFFHTMYHLAKVVYIYRENEALKLFLPTFYSAGVAVRCLVILVLLRPYRHAVMRIFRLGGRGRAKVEPQKEATMEAAKRAIEPRKEIERNMEAKRMDKEPAPPDEIDPEERVIEAKQEIKAVEPTETDREYNSKKGDPMVWTN